EQPITRTTTALPAPQALPSSTFPMTGLQALPTVEPRRVVCSVRPLQAPPMRARARREVRPYLPRRARQALRCSPARPTTGRLGPGPTTLVPVPRAPQGRAPRTESLRPTTVQASAPRGAEPRAWAPPMTVQEAARRRSARARASPMLARAALRAETLPTMAQAQGRQEAAAERRPMWVPRVKSAPAPTAWMRPTPARQRAAPRAVVVPKQVVRPARRRSGLLGLAAPARPQVEDARDERRYREDEIRINGFSWHPVEGLPCVGSVYESIAKTPACGPAPILRVDAFR